MQAETLSNSVKPICAILGGVGPMAGVKLHEKVINFSEASCDQDHMELVHLSTPIADRTKFLFSMEGPNPGDEMFEAVQGLSKLALQRKKYVIAGVPCNTFHSPKIWDNLFDQTKKMNNQIAIECKEKDYSVLPGQIYLIHMLEKTVEYCSGLGLKEIGLLSTSGTRKTGVYREKFNSVGMNVLEVHEDMQASVHDAIYNAEYGIKALNWACPKVVEAFRGFVKELMKKGATAVILGCTEIPIALPEKEFDGVLLIDPMDVLARALVASAGKLSKKQGLLTISVQNV